MSDTPLISKELLRDLRENNGRGTDELRDLLCHRAAAEIERLSKLCDEHADDSMRWHRIADERSAEVERLQRENKEIRTALVLARELIRIKSTATEPPLASRDELLDIPDFLRKPGEPDKEAKPTHCACGERLVGHEDESSTKCRWCVTGWKPSEGDAPQLCAALPDL